jgi:hypothetical protein
VNVEAMKASPTLSDLVEPTSSGLPAWYRAFYMSSSEKTIPFAWESVRGTKCTRCCGDHVCGDGQLTAR